MTTPPLPPNLPPAPGWYVDPERVDCIRYWEGGEWSDYVVPTPRPVPGGGEIGLVKGVLIVALGVFAGTFLAMLILSEIAEMGL